MCYPSGCFPSKPSSHINSVSFSLSFLSIIPSCSELSRRAPLSSHPISLWDLATVHSELKYLSSGWIWRFYVIKGSCQIEKEYSALNREALDEIGQRDSALSPHSVLLYSVVWALLCGKSQAIKVQWRMFWVLRSVIRSVFIPLSFINGPCLRQIIKLWEKSACGEFRLARFRCFTFVIENGEAHRCNWEITCFCFPLTSQPVWLIASNRLYICMSGCVHVLTDRNASKTPSAKFSCGTAGVKCLPFFDVFRHLDYSKLVS